MGITVNTEHHFRRYKDIDMKVRQQRLGFLGLKRLIGIIAGLVILSGCATSVEHLPLHTGRLTPAKGEMNTPPLAQPLTQQSGVDIQYLGVGGFLFQYGEDSIMTAPSFTNPSLLNVTLPLPISTDQALVDELLPEQAKQAEFILVGHAHYDHLLDVPYIMQRHMPTTKVVGSTTVTNIVAAVVDDDRLIDITNYAAVGNEAGQWLYNHHKTIRVMPIKAEHAPHFMGIKVMTGQYQQALTTLPSTAYGWKEGQTYAYVIDFLNAEQQPVYRIHYQDAASNSPAGLMPEMADSKTVDMAILCTAAFHQVDDYPDAILQQVQPKTVVLGHWEDFFANQGQPAKAVRMTDIDDFILRVEAAIPTTSSWLLPTPFSHFTVK